MRVPTPTSPAGRIRTTVADLQARRKAAQPTNRRTFGALQEPRPRAQRGSNAEACGLKGHRLGRAQISPKHANFIENAAAPARGRARPHGRGTAAGGGAVRGRARARGAAAWRPRAPASDAVGAAGAAAKLPPCPSGTTLPCPRPRVGSACGRRVSRSAGCGYGSGPTVVALRSPPRRLRHPARLLGRPDRGVLRSARGRGRRGAPRCRARSRPRSSRSTAGAWSRSTVTTSSHAWRLCRRSRTRPTTGPFPKRSSSASRARSGGRSCDAGRRRGWCRRADASSEGFLAAHARLPRIWVAPSVPVRVGEVVSDAAALRAVGALSALKKEPLPLPSIPSRPGGELVFRLARESSSASAGTTDLALKLAVARRVLAASTARPRTSCSST